MSDALHKAEQAVREASENTDVARIAAAVLATQQATQQPPAPAPAPAAPRRLVGMYVAAGIGGAVALSFLAMATALLAVAVAVSATCATACLIVIKSMWADYTKGR